MYFDEFNLDSNPPSQEAFLSDYDYNPKIENGTINNQFEKKLETQEEAPNNQMKIKKISYKNLPKLIGNNVCKYAEQNCNELPNGVRNLVEKRKKTKQYFTKIVDLRNLCQTDKQSQKLFKKYIKKQLFIDLVFSSRIQHPLDYVDGICNYYAASKEPSKMISSQLTQM